MFLIDANILITAYKKYYPFDFCAGFWDFILEQCGRGKIGLIKSIIDEIKDGNDELSEWIGDNIQSLNVIDNTIPEIQILYARIADALEYKKISKNHSDAEIRRFLDKADPWLIATALHYGYKVVTNENIVERNSSKVKIPNVCRYFDVDYEIEPFLMLRSLGLNLRHIARV